MAIDPEQTFDWLEIGARQKISEALLADLAKVWKAHGKQVLERLAKDDPGKLATIAYGLLPKDLFLQVEGGIDFRIETINREIIHPVMDDSGNMLHPRSPEYKAELNRKLDRFDVWLREHGRRVRSARGGREEMTVPTCALGLL